MAPQTMETARAAQTPHIIPRYLSEARLPCKESACALDLVGLQVRSGQKSPVDGACGSVHDFMTWAFQSAREYGLQTCASFESISKAFRTREGIAAQVHWGAHEHRAMTRPYVCKPI